MGNRESPIVAKGEDKGFYTQSVAKNDTFFV